jgi:hypothetical protein
MSRPAPLQPTRQRPLMLVWQPCQPRSGRPLRFAVFRNAFRERLRAAAARSRMALLDWLALPDGFLLLCDPASLAQLANFVGSLKSGTAADARRRSDRQLWRGRYAITLVQPAALAQCLLTMDLAATAVDLVLHPAAWTHSGWHELAGLRRRYRLLLPSAAEAALAAAGPCPAPGHSPDPDRHSYVALTEQCLRRRRHGSIQPWTAALAVGQSDWIDRLLAPLPEGSRHIARIAADDLPLDTPAPLLAVTSGRRRSRDLVYAILRAAAAQA